MFRYFVICTVFEIYIIKVVTCKYQSTVLEKQAYEVHKFNWSFREEYELGTVGDAAYYLLHKWAMNGHRIDMQTPKGWLPFSVQIMPGYRDHISLTLTVSSDIIQLNRVMSV